MYATFLDSLKWKKYVDKFTHSNFRCYFVIMKQIFFRYKNEVDAIFNFSLSFQFFSSTATVCLVIYRMTIVSESYLAFDVSTPGSQTTLD